MSMQNPLALHHEKMGALLENGNVPLQYGNPVEEYWTVRKSAGLADLSHLGRLRVRGKDSVSFLNGLLTNDIAKLKDSGGLHSALLNPKARVLADLYLYSRQDELIVDTGEAGSTRVKTILDQFVITEDVKIEDASESLLLLTVQGPNASQVISDFLKVDVQGLQPLQTVAQGPATVVARDRTGQGGYDIFLPRDEAEAVWNTLLLNGGELGLGPVGQRALDVLRLEKALPKYGVDVDENTIVLEAGFQDAISFTKGCYMGQEVVARATHIGRVNKRLVQLWAEGKGAPASGSKMRSGGKEVGFLTSARLSPGIGMVVALGYAQRDFAAEGQRLEVEDGELLVPAVVKRII